jgi:hypothetical protein
LGEIVCAVAAVIPLDNEKHWIIQAEFVVPCQMPLTLFFFFLVLDKLLLHCCPCDTNKTLLHALEMPYFTGNCWIFFLFENNISGRNKLRKKLGK